MAGRIRRPGPPSPADEREDRRLRDLAEAEFERAKDGDGAFCLLRVEIEALHLIEQVYGLEAATAIQTQVADSLLALAPYRDPIMFPDGRALLVAFPATRLDDALELARQAIERSKQLKPQLGGRPVPVALSIGVAHGAHVEDYSLATLERVAREGATVASAGGGDRCVHTELYTLLQPRPPRREERRKPSARELAEPRNERSLSWFGGAPRGAEDEPIGGPFAVADARELEIARRVHVPRPALVSEPSPDPRLAATTALRTAGDADEARELSQRLESIFRGPQAGALSPRQMQEAVIETVLTWKREQEIARQVQQRSEREHEVEQLKRRLAKISQSLADTENQLARLTADEADERGVASAFKTVQGIAADDPQLDLKKMMMKDLLEANLALRQHIG